MQAIRFMIFMHKNELYTFLECAYTVAYNYYDYCFKPYKHNSYSISSSYSFEREKKPVILTVDYINQNDSFAT